MIELGIAAGPPARRIERHNYTRDITGAVEQWVESGIWGAALGAVEIAAAHYSRAFAVATVEPAIPALSPAVLSAIARRLIAGGESCHVIDVDQGAVRLAECASWNVTGGARGPWRYQVDTVGPSTTETRHVSADQVVHCRYATLAGQPWIGVSPLTLAGTTGRLAVALEAALRWEHQGAADGAVGPVVALPVDAGGEVDAEGDGETVDPFAPLKKQINSLKGRIGLVETTSSGYGEGRAAAPRDDWQPHRLGPDPPAAMVELRAAVEETVLSLCGIPPGLARAAGGESRESYRRWYAAGVLPLARLVESELQTKLDAPALRLKFDALAAADVHGRARAWRSLVGQEAKMPDADARRIVGLDG